jgi:hypothetical protein
MYEYENEKIEKIEKHTRLDTIEFDEEYENKHVVFT